MDFFAKFLNYRKPYIYFFLISTVVALYYISGKRIGNSIELNYGLKDYLNDIWQPTKKGIKEKKQINSSNYIINDYASYEAEYLKKLFVYLTRWRDSLNSGKNQLITYLDVLDDTHSLLVEEQKRFEYNVTERPIPLSKQLNCANPAHASFLTSEPREKPSMVLDFILMAYELSIMEIRLYELYDAIDEFIIFEANVTFKNVRKPYFFLDNINRYQRFLDKIILITPFNITRYNKHDLSIAMKIDVNNEDIPDDFKTSILPEDKKHEDAFFKADFDMDTITRKLILKLYDKYVRKVQDDDIIIHGDIDELVSGNAAYHLKHCKVKEELYPFSVWSTFYIYNFNHLFPGGWTAGGDTYSMKFPNILKIKDIKRFDGPRVVDTRTLSRATGCHLNRFFITFAISLYKEMSQSDGLKMSDSFFNVIKAGTKEAVDHMKMLYRTAQIHQMWAPIIVNKKILTPDKTVFVPWIVEANKHVYEDFL